MVIKNINLEEIMNTRQFDKGSKYQFYRKDGLFYKIVSLQRDMLPSEKEMLLNLESKLDMLEKSEILSLEGICGPTHKLYYNGQFVGYGAHDLIGYVGIIDASTTLNNSQKIKLLIELSKIIKKIHEKNVAHTDIYSDNVLTNGSNIGLIDFDEAVLFKREDLVSYYNSPYTDIEGINNLVIRLLTTENFGRSKKNKNNCLPKEVAKYIKWYNESNHMGLIRAEMPDEYPHDWLNELKPYIGETGSFQRRL